MQSSRLLNLFESPEKVLSDCAVDPKSAVGIRLVAKLVVDVT